MVCHLRHQRLVKDSFHHFIIYTNQFWLKLLLNTIKDSRDTLLLCFSFYFLLSVSMPFIMSSLCFSGLQSQADDSLLRYPRSPSLQPAGDAWQLKHICFKGMYGVSTQLYLFKKQTLPTVLFISTLLRSSTLNLWLKHEEETGQSLCHIMS